MLLRTLHHKTLKKEEFMNLVALLLTYLFFCHPKLLAVICIVVGIIMLFVYYPIGMFIFGLVLLGFLFYSAFVK